MSHTSMAELSISEQTAIEIHNDLSAARNALAEAHRELGSYPDDSARALALALDAMTQEIDRRIATLPISER